MRSQIDSLTATLNKTPPNNSDNENDTTLKSSPEKKQKHISSHEQENISEETNPTVEFHDDEVSRANETYNSHSRGSYSMSGVSKINIIDIQIIMEKDNKILEILEVGEDVEEEN